VIGDWLLVDIPMFVCGKRTACHVILRNTQYGKIMSLIDRLSVPTEQLPKTNNSKRDYNPVWWKRANIFAVNVRPST